LLLSWSFWTNNFIVMYFILNWVIKRKLNIYSIEVQKLFNDSDSDIFSKEFLNKVEREFLIVKIKGNDITHIFYYYCQIEVYRYRIYIYD